jgi:protein-tyrosine phosphatase
MSGPRGIMIDIHCHILPATDDGPKSWDITLEMCEKAAIDGITHIVATPHCNHRYPYERAAVEAKVKELRSRFSAIEFSAGCELSITERNLELALRQPEHFTIGSTSYMLVELNEAYMPKQLEDTLGELISLGITPILAHPERNPLLRRRFDLLEEWIAMGCLSAITGNSLLGFWGGDIRKITDSMVRAGLVHLIVSDGHDPKTRPVILKDALAAAGKLIGRERAHDLVWANPSSVLQGESVPA